MTVTVQIRVSNGVQYLKNLPWLRLLSWQPLLMHFCVSPNNRLWTTCLKSVERRGAEFDSSQKQNQFIDCKKWHKWERWYYSAAIALWYLCDVMACIVNFLVIFAVFDVLVNVLVNTCFHWHVHKLHFYRAIHFSANARYWDRMSSVRLWRWWFVIA